jgi:hypothetical protein
MSRIETFNANKKAITERVIGSVLQHFIKRGSGEETISHSSLKLITLTKQSRDEIKNYIDDTLKHTEDFFSVAKLGEHWTDHQCDLIMDIYRQYSKQP